MRRSLLFAVVSAAVLMVAVSGFEEARADTPNSAKVSWGASTQAVDGSAITGVTYKLYQGLQGQPKVVVDSNITTLTHTVSNLPYGTVCFQVSAFTAAGGESALTNEACKSFVNKTPKTPGTITVE